MASSSLVTQVTHVMNNSQNMPVSTFSLFFLYPKLHFSMLHVCLGQPQQHYNDVWTLLPHFPLFSRTHLVKPGAADRTAGLLMITFSRCPIVCILWPFPLKNSRWTATAPSQMPFLHLLMPRQPLESQTSLSKEERGEKGYFIWLWVLKLTVSLYEVYHYSLEKAQDDS